LSEIQHRPITDTKEETLNPWDIVNSITTTKKHILENPKDYSPYFVNKALSYNYDCVFHANVMNINRWASNNMQYDYLINTIRAKKRPHLKWYKDKYNKENLDVIIVHYKVSMVRAKEILDLLSEDQLMDIKKQQEKGGLT
jgi:hypothetical protein